MKKYLVVMLVSMGFLTCGADITPVTTMKEVLKYVEAAKKNTWVIFDVDMVLVQPSEPAFQMVSIKRFYPQVKTILKQIPPEKHMIFFALMSTQFDPILVDADAPMVMQKIAQKGLSAMALTANLTGKLGQIPSMEAKRISTLKSFGIDFAKTAPYPKPLVFDKLASYRGNYCKYEDGILFVNGQLIPKGEALLAFLKETDLLPDAIIFIDDREDDLKSVESALLQLERPIAYQGLQFLGAQEYPTTPISVDEFEEKWVKLASQAKQMD